MTVNQSDIDGSLKAPSTVAISEAWTYSGIDFDHHCAKMFNHVDRNHPRGAKTLVVIVEPSSVGVINFRASQNTSLGRHFHTATHDASQSSMCCPPESV